VYISVVQTFFLELLRHAHVTISHGDEHNKRAAKQCDGLQSILAQQIKQNKRL